MLRSNILAVIRTQRRLPQTALPRALCAVGPLNGCLVAQRGLCSRSKSLLCDKARNEELERERKMREQMSSAFGGSSGTQQQPPQQQQGGGPNKQQPSNIWEFMQSSYQDAKRQADKAVDEKYGTTYSKGAASSSSSTADSSNNTTTGNQYTGGSTNQANTNQQQQQQQQQDFAQARSSAMRQLLFASLMFYVGLQLMKKGYGADVKNLAVPFGYSSGLQQAQWFIFCVAVPEPARRRAIHQEFAHAKGTLPPLTSFFDWLERAHPELCTGTNMPRETLLDTVSRAVTQIQPYDATRLLSKIGGEGFFGTSSPQARIDNLAAAMIGLVPGIGGPPPPGGAPMSGHGGFRANHM